MNEKNNIIDEGGKKTNFIGAAKGENVRTPMLAFNYCFHRHLRVFGVENAEKFFLTETK